jgi:dephospho-CoA kinase
MKRIGITGGIGSGKTIISEIFKSLGIPVFSADLQGRALMESDEEVIRCIKKEFGEELYDQRLQLNRKKLAGMVFSDNERLKALNAIVHPAVGKSFNNWIKLNQGKKFVLKESAILFETGLNKELDQIITVYAPKELRITRVMKRDQLSREEIEKRISSQMPDEEKIKLSDYIIFNDEQRLVIPQVIEIYNALSR